MKKYRVINKKRFYLFLAITFFLSLATIIFLTSSIKAYSIALTDDYQELYVLKGDTLWDIALKYKPSKYDVRDMVYKIKKINNIDRSYIFPGEIIKIPIIK